MENKDEFKLHEIWTCKHLKDIGFRVYKRGEEYLVQGRCAGLLLAEEANNEKEYQSLRQRLATNYVRTFPTEEKKEKKEEEKKAMTLNEYAKAQMEKKDKEHDKRAVPFVMVDPDKSTYSGFKYLIEVKDLDVEDRSYRVCMTEVDYLRTIPRILNELAGGAMRNKNIDPRLFKNLFGSIGFNTYENFSLVVSSVRNEEIKVLLVLPNCKLEKLDN